ncbi:MAG: hypothetical protein QW273_01305, partial [Candidatus Pacearchaeota archaeon]
MKERLKETNVDTKDKLFKERPANFFKLDKRIQLNLFFLGICFSLFTFIAATNIEIFRKKILIALELTCAIPLFLNSTFARIKEV